MLQVRALKPFQSKYGMIRVGQRFSCEPNYFEDLKRNHMVELIPDRNEPKNRQSMSVAPITLGKVEPSSPPPIDESSTLAAPKLLSEAALSLADGSARQSSSSRAGRRSLKPT